MGSGARVEVVDGIAAAVDVSGASVDDDEAASGAGEARTDDGSVVLRADGDGATDG